MSSHYLSIQKEEWQKYFKYPTAIKEISLYGVSVQPIPNDSWWSFDFEWGYYNIEIFALIINNAIEKSIDEYVEFKMKQ